MTTKEFVERNLAALEGEREELRKMYTAALVALSQEATAHADRGGPDVPPIAFLETKMETLRELREAIRKAEHGANVLRQVVSAFEFMG